MTSGWVSTSTQWRCFSFYWLRVSIGKESSHCHQIKFNKQAITSTYPWYDRWINLNMHLIEMVAQTEFCSLGSSHKSMSRSFSVDSQTKGSVSIPNAWTIYINLTYFSLTVVDIFPVICLKPINVLVVQLLKNIVQKVDLSKLEMSALWRYYNQRY
jgi:hypothetical protein